MDPQTFRFFRYFLGQYPLRSIWMIGLLLVAGLAEGLGLAALLPVLEIAVEGGEGGDSALRKAVVDVLAVIGLEPSLVALLTLIVLALTLKALFRWLAMWEVGKSVAQVGADLRFQLIRSVIAARWNFFVSHPIGFVSNAVGWEAYHAASAYRRALSVLAAAIQILVYGLLIVLVSWQIAVVAGVAGVLVMVFLRRFVGMSRGAGKDQTEVLQSVTARLTDALQGIKAIKAMALEGEILPTFERGTERLKEAERRYVLANESLGSFNEPILAVMIAAGLWGAVRWGGEPFSALLLMVFLFYRFTGRFHTLQVHYQDVVRGESAFWSLETQRRTAVAQAEADLSEGEPPPLLTDKIELSSVSFRYADRPVLVDVSLEIGAGELAALLGPSGSGKTTIADLIIGLYRPDAGEIRVDGVPMSRMNGKAWRRSIGYVPQETLLFHDTVARNVILGDDEPDEHLVEHALRGAGAWNFVRELPDGVRTVIGERGAKLSGGQRQRIAIARALARAPKLLVLDEATAALDPVTEREIVATLEDLRGSLTIIAISHQKGLFGVADRVYEVRGGRVRLASGVGA